MTNISLPIQHTCTRLDKGIILLLLVEYKYCFAKSHSKSNNK